MKNQDINKIKPDAWNEVEPKDFDFTRFSEEGNKLDSIEKYASHLKRQIDELAIFISTDHNDKICGSAVETAIVVMKEQSQRIKTLKLQYNRIVQLINNTKREDDNISTSDKEIEQHYPNITKKAKINLIKPPQTTEVKKNYERAMEIVE